MGGRIGTRMVLDQHDRGGMTVCAVGLAAIVGLSIWGSHDLGTVPDTTPAETCYSVSHDQYAVGAINNLIITGDYLPQQARWLGEEDSQIVDDAIYLHRVAAGLPADHDPDAVPICQE